MTIHHPCEWKLHMFLFSRIAFLPPAFFWQGFLLANLVFRGNTPLVVICRHAKLCSDVDDDLLLHLPSPALWFGKRRTWHFGRSLIHEIVLLESTFQRNHYPPNLVNWTHFFSKKNKNFTPMPMDASFLFEKIWYFCANYAATNETPFGNSPKWWWFFQGIPPKMQKKQV